MYKKFIEGKKLVCFDLDGTVVDSEPYFALAFSKILHLANPDIALGQVYGRAGESLSDKWAKIADSKLIRNNMTVKELTENTYKEFLNIISKNTFELRPGFWDLIYKLKEDKGMKIALTTNTLRAVASQEMGKLEIGDVFDFIICGDEVKYKKPDPEIYLQTAKKVQVKPTEMLVFEDSVAGATAASRSGASLIVIWDGQTSETLFPKETLAFTPDFDGLAENLDFTMEEIVENYKKATGTLTDQQTQK